MDNTEAYTIIFEGHITSGKPLEHVKAQVGTAFRIDAARVEQLFATAPVVLKRGLTYQDAQKYQRAFEKTGAQCRIIKEPDPHAPKTPSSVSAPSVRQVPPVQSQKQSGEQAMLTCPKCGFQQADGRKECLRCGIVFRRFQSQKETVEDEEVVEQIQPPRRRQKPEEDAAVGVLTVDREGWIALGVGLAITMIVLMLPFLTFVFSYLKTLVHEFGHAVFGWLFAYPSIPAFDFSYGGGVALTDERMPALFILIYGGFAYLGFLFRKNTLTLILIGILTALYSLCAFTDMHQILILFMGHGSELLFASIFLYRAVSGSGIIVAAERPLYAFVGLFIEFLDLQFAYQLMTNPAYRFEYSEAKGGGNWMDFSRIAEEFLHVDITVVAGFFLVCCFLPPLCAFLFYRYQTYLVPGLIKLLRTERED